jgi:hypothetical protein
MGKYSFQTTILKLNFWDMKKKQTGFLIQISYKIGVHQKAFNESSSFESKKRRSPKG